MSDRPVKVCIDILGFHNGGVERVFESYLSNMDRSALDIHFVTHMDPDESVQKRFEAMGCTVHRLARVCGHKPTRQNFKEYDEFFKGNSYDVVHNNFPHNLFPLYFAKKYNVPLRILHSHNDYEANMYDKSSPRKRLYSLGFWFNSRNATCRLGCGVRAAETAFGRDCIVKGKATILPNAINTDRFAFDQAVRDDMRMQLGVEKSFVVGHIGRYEDEQKNQPFVLRVFAELLKVRPNARLLMLGEGKKRTEVMALADELEIRDTCIFTGAVSNVPDYLMAMDVFCFPSLFEGFGIAQIEAQCTGLHGISSDIITPEANVLGLFKFLSLHDDPSVWAQALLDVATAPRTDRSAALKAAGYDIVSNANRLRRLYLSGSRDLDG